MTARPKSSTDGAPHSFGSSGFVTLEGGRRIHYMERGSGEVTVVFESGLGFSRSTWGLVAPVIGDCTRTVVYDRAGLGRSDDDDEPRTLERLADDLDALLTGLGEGPYLLVGHSWGGPIVRAAASANPERIAGIVLVDQTDERCSLYFDRSSAKRFAQSSRMLPTLARLRLYGPLAGGPGRVQPADVAADHRTEDFTQRAAATSAAEMADLLQDLAHLREQPLDLHGIPVIVISGTKASALDRAQRTALTASHRATAEALNARFVEAPQSGHLVMFSEPQLVIDQIVRLLDNAERA
jgi:pimeloyl-ACP methyl ester carboxylesterase